ncbi:glycine zipper family protein [Ruegeria arenilitoris]|uniref:glycine zipper family protein n=1 Tax=Ruegeria arenilitoris TaxID=1173585 RepID=UPI00147BF451|nr:glycine zipper family protein [Ruegeria arenilitoris]
MLFKERFTLTVLPLALVTAACSGTGAQHQPVLSAEPGPAYAADLDQCRALAKSQDLWNPETRSQALIGAGIGAMAGISDDTVGNAEGAIAGAAVGSAAGAAAGAAEMRNTRRDILIECLRQRGHPAAG